MMWSTFHNSTGIQTPPASLERRTAFTIATPAKPSSIVGKVSPGSAIQSFLSNNALALAEPLRTVSPRNRKTPRRTVNDGSIARSTPDSPCPRRTCTKTEVLDLCGSREPEASDRTRFAPETWSKRNERDRNRTRLQQNQRT
jgi:hypothetical protein